MESTSKAIDSTPYSIMNSPKHIFISPISIRYKKIRFLVPTFFLDIILHKRIKMDKQKIKPRNYIGLEKLTSVVKCKK